MTFFLTFFKVSLDNKIDFLQTVRQGLGEATAYLELESNSYHHFSIALICGRTKLGSSFEAELKLKLTFNPEGQDAI